MQGAEFNISLIEEDKRIGFQQGYKVVPERIRSAQGSTDGFIGVSKLNK